jgi:hypothetical protein
VNAVERASRDILIALVIEANRGVSNIPDLEELRERYNLKISDMLLPSSIEEWDNLDLLIASRTYDGTGACIKPGKYGPALSILLELLDATTFEVSWQKEEILTDAKIWSDFPGMQGWKILTFEGETGADANESFAWTDVTPPLDDDQPDTHSSSKWTGSRLILVDSEVIARVKVMANELHQRVHSMRFESNSDSFDLKALADAFVSICEMAEPEITIMDRILASPKFKAYAGLFAFVATIRGAIGI